MDKTITALESIIKANRLLIEPTTTDACKFETNIKAQFMCDNLTKINDTMCKQNSYIGIYVHRFVGRLMVISKETYKKDIESGSIYKGLNKVEEKEIYYTKQDFEEYKKWHLSFLIERFTEEILRNPFQNSTSPVSNLVHQWQTEAKIKLIELFKGLHSELI
jgi:hypothetical protein